MKTFTSQNTEYHLKSYEVHHNRASEVKLQRTFRTHTSYDVMTAAQARKLAVALNAAADAATVTSWVPAGQVV